MVQSGSGGDFKKTITFVWTCDEVRGGSGFKKHYRPARGFRRPQEGRRVMETRGTGMSGSIRFGPVTGRS